MPCPGTTPQHYLSPAGNSKPTVSLLLPLLQFKIIQGQVRGAFQSRARSHVLPKVCGTANILRKYISTVGVASRARKGTWLLKEIKGSGVQCEGRNVSSVKGKHEIKMGCPRRYEVLYSQQLCPRWCQPRWQMEGKTPSKGTMKASGCSVITYYSLPTDKCRIWLIWKWFHFDCLLQLCAGSVLPNFYSAGPRQHQLKPAIYGTLHFARFSGCFAIVVAVAGQKWHKYI